MTNALRVLHTLLAIAGAGLLTILAVALLIPVDTPVVDTRFETARLCTEPPVDTAYSRAGLSALLTRGPPSDCPQAVSLPYKSRPGDLKLRRQNIGPLGLAWYFVRYDIPEGWKPDDRLMIYSPRVLGVAWQTRVNDQFIFDDLDDWRMTWNQIGRAHV